MKLRSPVGGPLKKNIKLVAALTGCSLAILIPVVAAIADTVTVCPPGASLEYCSVSNFHSWTVSQKRKTVTATVRFDGGSFDIVGLSLPSGVTLSTTSSSDIPNYLSFKVVKHRWFFQGTKKDPYTVSSISSRSLSVSLSSAKRRANVVFRTGLFKTTDRSFSLTLAVKTAAGDVYLEKVPVKM